MGLYPLLHDNGASSSKARRLASYWPWRRQRLSGNTSLDATLYTQRRTGGRISLARRRIHAQTGHLFRSGEAPEQRGGTVLFQKQGFHLLDRYPRSAARPAIICSAPFVLVGPGRMDNQLADYTQVHTRTYSSWRLYLAALTSFTVDPIALSDEVEGRY